MDSHEDATNRINELNKELYRKQSVRVGERKRGILHKESFPVPTTWKEETDSKDSLPSQPMHTSFFKRLFLCSLLILCGSIAYAAYVFLGNNNVASSANIDMEIIGNSFTAGGEPLTLQVEVTNRNNLTLEGVDLLVEYPKGGVTETGSDIVRLPRIALGSIAPGRSASESISVTLFGEEGSAKEIKATIEYRVEGSDALFDKTTSYPITINSAPLALRIEAPTETSTGQEITALITVTSLSEENAENLLLRIDYPPGFRYSDANPKPATNTNIWELGDFTKGMEKKIEVKGSFVAQDGEERTFRVYAGEADPNNLTSLLVTYTSALHTVFIKKPFLATKILVNGADIESPVVSGTDDINFEIVWANNLDTKVTDVEVEAILSGNALDENSVTTNTGFYNSLTNTIIWDKTTRETLAEVDPGEEGVLTFNLASIPLYAQNVMLTSPTIVVEVSIQAKQPTLGGSISAVSNFLKKTIKIATNVQIAGKTLYKDGPFINTGPIPPQAEKETTYTIVWSATNSANDITQAEAVATLPSYVEFVGETAPGSETIIYDEASRIVTWKLDTIAKGTGLTKPLREASFKVRITPSTTQIGDVPVLLYETVLTGKDAYTGTVIRGTRAALTTSLYNDTLQDSGKVVQ